MLFGYWWWAVNDFLDVLAVDEFLYLYLEPLDSIVAESNLIVDCTQFGSLALEFLLTLDDGLGCLATTKTEGEDYCREKKGNGFLESFHIVDVLSCTSCENL